MKYSEWRKLNNINSDEEEMNFFRYNIQHDKLPVAIYVCPVCDEIIDNPLYGCDKCNKGENSGDSE
jgi:hypothetical protein